MKLSESEVGGGSATIRGVSAFSADRLSHQLPPDQPTQLASGYHEAVCVGGTTDEQALKTK